MIFEPSKPLHGIWGTYAHKNQITMQKPAVHLRCKVLQDLPTLSPLPPVTFPPTAAPLPGLNLPPLGAQALRVRES